MRTLAAFAITWQFAAPDGMTAILVVWAVAGDLLHGLERLSRVADFGRSARADRERAKAAPQLWEQATRTERGMPN